MSTLRKCTIDNHSLLSLLVTVICRETRGCHQFNLSSLTSCCVKFSGWTWLARRTRRCRWTRPSRCSRPKRWCWSTWHPRRKGDDRLTKFCSYNRGQTSSSHDLSVFYNWSLRTVLLSFEKRVAVITPHPIQCWKSGEIAGSSFQHCMWGVGGGFLFAFGVRSKAPKVQICSKTFLHDCRCFSSGGKTRERGAIE